MSPDRHGEHRSDEESYYGCLVDKGRHSRSVPAEVPPGQQSQTKKEGGLELAQQCLHGAMSDLLRLAHLLSDLAGGGAPPSPEDPHDLQLHLPQPRRHLRQRTFLPSKSVSTLINLVK